jgi:hypothetical protein
MQINVKFILYNDYFFCPELELVDPAPTHSQLRANFLPAAFHSGFVHTLQVIFNTMNWQSMHPIPIFRVNESPFSKKKAVLLRQPFLTYLAEFKFLLASLIIMLGVITSYAVVGLLQNHLQVIFSCQPSDDIVMD